MKVALGDVVLFRWLAINNDIHDQQTWSGYNDSME